jgi:hypothetical protein
MRIVSILFLSLSACAGAPKPAPTNFAAQYAHAAFPEADVVAVGASSALGREGDVVFFCGADAQHHTACRALADWRPKPAPVVPSPSTPVAPTPTPSAAPAAPEAKHDLPTPPASLKAVDVKPEKKK